MDFSELKKQLFSRHEAHKVARHMSEKTGAAWVVSGPKVASDGTLWRSVAPSRKLVTANTPACGTIDLSNQAAGRQFFL